MMKTWCNNKWRRTTASHEPDRIFTDEDIHGALAGELRKAGYQALSTPEAGRTKCDDADQLNFATTNGMVLVTFNVGDLAQLHQDLMQKGQKHSGIIASKQRPIGDLLRRLLNLGTHLSAEDMRDRFEFLTRW